MSELKFIADMVVYSLAAATILALGGLAVFMVVASYKKWRD